MDERLYDVIFAGELVAGADPAEVRRRLAALFKGDAAAIERLFSGATVVIRKGADEATAFRYRDAMRKAGAVSEVRASARTGAGATGGTAAGDLASAAILPPGTLLPQPPPVEVPVFDLAGLTLAQPGEDLSGPSSTQPAPVPDVSGITIAPPGSDLLGDT